MQNADPTAPEVRHALVSLYGAVACLVREDHDAVHLMLSDLHDAFDDVGDLLVTISLATLSQLAATVDGCARRVAPEVLEARDVLDVARSFRLASDAAVDAAAWRLDAVRRGDRARSAADILTSHTVATGTELTGGAIALLAAIVAINARRGGRSARVAAADLCMAASLAASC